MAETTDSAVLASGLQAEHAEGLGHDNALLLVVGWGDTFEGLQTLHRGVTAGGLVRNHATDGAPEHLGGSAEVEGTWVRLEAALELPMMGTVLPPRVGL